MDKNVKIFTVLYLALAVLLIFSTATAADATTFRIYGRVIDQSSDPLANSLFEVIDPATNATLASASTGPDGTYELYVESRTYNIKVTPPAGSGLGAAIVLNKTINADTEIDFVLVTAGSTTLSGRLLDPLGEPIPGILIGLAPLGTSNWMYQHTDAEGVYSYVVAPGDYIFFLDKDGNPGSNTPSYFNLTLFGDTPIHLEADTVLDMVLPTKQVRVHVQDPGGNTVANVGIHTNWSTNYQLTMGSYHLSGTSGYITSSPPVVTDANGDATLWLFPTCCGRSYTFTATPPEGSGYATTNLSDVEFTEDIDVTITLVQPITLSGRLLDPLGEPIPGILIGLAPLGTSNWMYQHTDAEGVYSYVVAPGDYIFFLDKDGNPGSNTPSYFNLTLFGDTPIHLEADTVLDMVLPTKQVRVHVQDPGGNTVANVGIHTNWSTNYQLTMGSYHLSGTSGYITSSPPVVTDANGDATLWLFPTCCGRSYTFTATPPEGSGYATTNLSDVEFTEDIDVTITLVQPITLSGRLLDPLGDPIPGILIGLAPLGTSNWMYQHTDAEGVYSYVVAPGDYIFFLDKDGNPGSNTPSYFNLTLFGDTPIHLEADTVLDMVLPTKQVRVHVQDPGGNTVANVGIHTNWSTNYQLTMGSYHLSGTSGYITSSPPVVTDANGDATLWLFPTCCGRSYTFTVIPPLDSPFITFYISDILLTEDKEIVIVLEFAHDPPLTTITLDAEQNEAGEYYDPVTVSLSATAAEGYSIDATYYSVDGSEEQTYTGPFTVSGAGEHTITYWSVDDYGVYEVPKTETFVIMSNQPPEVDAGGTYSGDEGSPIALNGTSASDPDGDSLTYSWDVINTILCSFSDTSVLNPEITCGDNGSYDVTITVEDGVNSPVSSSTTVTINNVAPTMTSVTVPIDPVSIDNLVAASGTFTDPAGTNDEPYTCTVNYGDTTGEQPGTVSGNECFGPDHVYDEPGVYTVIVTVTDKDGGSGSLEAAAMIVIYDPDGGFVTGAGWIWSEVGSCHLDAECEGAEGKANYGFVSKYKKGTSIPTGNTQFKFKAGGLNFQSDSYDWLVVAGNTAKYKGVGSVNGVEGYKFQIWAKDGDLKDDPDTFRIKIWWEDDDGIEHIVYDNGSEQEIGGGNIVVHSD